MKYLGTLSVCDLTKKVSVCWEIIYIVFDAILKHLQAAKFYI